MKAPITKLAVVLALTILMAGEALAQNAQWNSLFDRIIRLEANVKNLARSGGGSAGGSGGGFQRTQSNDQMRQLLNEVRQMRQQLLGMDARLRRLEKNSGRSGSLPTKRQPIQQQIENLNTFAQNDLEQYDINNEPQIFVEIGESHTRVPTSQGVPIAPIARAPVARAPANWQTTRPQKNTQVAAIPFQDKRPVNANGNSGGVERVALDGNQVSEQSVAQKLFDRSRSALLARRYGAAESGFKSFMNKYAGHNLASGAQFMLGETYYVQRNWRLAAQSYLQGYRKYPKGTKAGDTLLKLGMSLGKLGQKSQSCGAFETVVSKYKASGSAVRQARKEIVRAKC